MGSTSALGARGQIDIYSGADGSVVHSANGAGPGDGLGGNIMCIGDIDLDGYADFAVAARGVFNNGEDAGRVYVVSGRAGELLWSVKGEARNWLWGSRMDSAGDVNADGIDDFIIGAESDDIVADGRGSATVYSGFDASVLFRFDGEDDLDFMGSSVDGGYDADGDGIPDFVVGTKYTDVNAERSGRMQIFSGADGSELWRLEGDNTADGFGATVAALGDVDQNGTHDVIVGAPSTTFSGGTGMGYVRVFGGPTSPNELFMFTSTTLATDEYHVGLVYGADPLGIVQVFLGTGQGPSHLLGVGGLDIRNPELISIGTANLDGRYRFGHYVPASLAGTAMWLQAADNTGSTSNIVFAQVP